VIDYSTLTLGGKIKATGDSVTCPWYTYCNSLKMSKWDPLWKM